MRGTCSGDGGVLRERVDGLLGGIEPYAYGWDVEPALKRADVDGSRSLLVSSLSKSRSSSSSCWMSLAEP
jgi:hypothetical protein